MAELVLENATTAGEADFLVNEGLEEMRVVDEAIEQAIIVPGNKARERSLKVSSDQSASGLIRVGEWRMDIRWKLEMASKVDRPADKIEKENRN